MTALTAAILPEEGIDLLLAIRQYQRSFVAQALHRAHGNRDAAAKLLRVTPLDLARLEAGARVSVRPPGPIMKQPHETPDESVTPVSPVCVGALPSLPHRPHPPLQPPQRRVPVEDMPRLDQGIERISRAVIRRLDADGLTPRQIASRLGVNAYVIEKVLRAEAELRKCGAVAVPERERA